MDNTVIKVEGLSKQYRLGEISTGSLAHDINRWWHRLRGNEDPYLKIGESNDRTQKGQSEYVWALRDINFEVKQGEVLGIIGRNGAGKSTLLKILSRTTSPTEGSVKVRGRVASLLEVGTGFHPELTGRDNIFLNGAILGMTKAEIKRKFDEIVDFAGVERYIDTPVKRYSSGMYVRLAFAVAAHLEPEILIVDEVLAVGDAEFQKKCLGKMKDVSVNDGRTVLFVSHNMGAVSTLCNRGILMNLGSISEIGRVSTVIDKYIDCNTSLSDAIYEFQKLAIGETKQLFFTKIYLTNHENKLKTDFDVFESVFLNIFFKSTANLENIKLSVTLQGKTGDYLSTFMLDLDELKIGEYYYCVKVEKNLIAPNSYYLRYALFVLNGEIYDLVEMINNFKIHDTGTELALAEGVNYGNFLLKYEIVDKKNT